MTFQHPLDPSGRSSESGKRAVEGFHYTALRYGAKYCGTSDINQDMIEHWDLQYQFDLDTHRYFFDETEIRPVKIDVKAGKSDSQHLSVRHSWRFLLEALNVKGKEGWIYAGIQELIAFEVLQYHFMMFLKTDLMRFVDEIWDKSIPPVIRDPQSPDFVETVDCYVPYRRYTPPAGVLRTDLFFWVPVEDLKQKCRWVEWDLPEDRERFRAQVVAEEQRRAIPAQEDPIEKIKRQFRL